MLPKQLKQSVFSSFVLLSAICFFTRCSKGGGSTPDNKNATTNKTTVSLFAGSGIAGASNGTGSAASFNSPVSLATDDSGNIYVADAHNNQIRKISPAGVVSTFAGSGLKGKANGAAASASFNGPYGIAVDASGNVYVADMFNELIRKITPDGTVSTLAGRGTVGNQNGTSTAASFQDPDCLLVDAAGNIYVGEDTDIRKISPSGVVTTFAGNPHNGSSNGTGIAASFYIIQGMAFDASGNIYAADSGNNLIRKITPAGVVTTVAGLKTFGAVNGDISVATFGAASGVAVDVSGNIYVADSGNNLIRKISTSGMVSTIAGTGAVGSANGDATVATFNNPVGMTIDASGNIYIADDNNIIRKISFH